MVFTELRFLLFFTAVFCVHWALRERRERQLWLLLASYGFYAAWDWRFLSLLWLVTGFSYWVARRMGVARNDATRRRWLVLGVLLHLGVLVVFKANGFFAQSFASLLGALGLGAGWVSLRIVLPLGLSFYTLQTLGYLIDVYRRDVRPCSSVADFALFVAFFPKLLCGPLVRSSAFLSQLARPRGPDAVDWRSAQGLVLIGWLKKAGIADQIAPRVDQFFTAPGDFGTAAAWVATLLFGVQLYCDLSGYSDMAVGCAKLLGYDLPENFSFPYLASSMRDFWRRWHCTWADWFHDYVYVALGGGSSGIKAWRNLLLTSLLAGLWHGFAWAFVLWGAMHGVALALQKAWSAWRGPSATSLWNRILGWAATLVCVHLAWGVFRAGSGSEALSVLGALAHLGVPGERGLPPVALVLLLALGVLLALEGLWRRSVWWQRLEPWQFGLLYGGALGTVLMFVRTQATPFYYFRF